jgi:hypothetical protein
VRANAASTVYGLNQDAIQTILTLGGKNASGQEKELYFTLSAGTPNWTLQTASVGTDAGINIYPNTTNGLRIASSGVASFNNTVGIGNTAPTEALHVTGRIRATTIDSTATAMNMLYADATGVIKKAAVPSGSGTITTAEADISSNYTVTATDHFVFLPALETASRNIVLPNDAPNGRQLIFFNTSNDATYKWIFTNEDVEYTTGTAVTTLGNQTSYTMVYYDGKFRLTAIN